MLPAHGRCGAYARCISTLIGMPAGSDRGWSTPILTWLAPCMGIAADPATLSCGGGWAVCCSGGLGVGGWLVKTRPTTSRSRAHTASTSPRYASWSTRTSRGPTSGCTSFRPMSSTAWPLATTKTAPRISPVRRCFFVFFGFYLFYWGPAAPTVARPISATPDPSLPSRRRCRSGPRAGPVPVACEVSGAPWVGGVGGGVGRGDGGRLAVGL